MDLKNCIHFYLGCPVWICKNIEGIDVIEPLTRKMLYEDIDQGDMFFDPEDLFPHKLILRPLQYLTEEEIDHVLWLIHNSEVHLTPDCAVDKDEISIDSIDPDDNAVVVNHTIRCFIGKLYLSEHSGYLRLYDENDVEQPIEWKPELFAYLCKQGIDIFNLIPTNQALDQTKL